MKKLFKTLTVLVAITALGFGFASCKNNDDDSSSGGALAGACGAGAATGKYNYNGTGVHTIDGTVVAKYKGTYTDLNAVGSTNYDYVLTFYQKDGKNLYQADYYNHVEGQQVSETWEIGFYKGNPAVDGTVYLVTDEYASKYTKSNGQQVTEWNAAVYKKNGDVDASGERIKHDASWWLANGDLSDYIITISEGKIRAPVNEVILHCKYPYMPTGLYGLCLERQ